MMMVNYMSNELDKSTLVWKKEPKLHPPPPPKVIEKPKRKTISIHIEEYNRWIKIKGKMTWTLVMRDARIAYEAVRSMRKQITRLNDTLQKIALENAKLLVKGASPLRSRSVPSVPSAFTKHSGTAQNFNSINGKSDPTAELMAEIRSLQKSTDDIRSILKPLDEMSEEELQAHELTPEELEKRWEKNNKKKGEP